jgi:hypothetical protein
VVLDARQVLCRLSVISETRQAERAERTLYVRPQSGTVQRNFLECGSAFSLLCRVL